MRQQGVVLQGEKSGKSTKNCLFHGVFWLKWQFNAPAMPLFFHKKTALSAKVKYNNVTLTRKADSYPSD
jgi:hypothetical protein